MISNHQGQIFQNFQNFDAKVEGPEEEDSSATVFPAAAILESLL